MNQLANVLGMNADADLLQVQSVEDKAEFVRGGSCHGYRYEWGVNHYSFSENKELAKEVFGLTDTEYDYWDSKYVNRFDWEKDEWYKKESVKTFEILVTGE